jgi:CRP-like cAMP-binding protein
METLSNPELQAPLLGKAAISHIELAVLNLSRQVHCLQTEDWVLLDKLASQLQVFKLSHATSAEDRVLQCGVDEPHVCPSLFESQRGPDFEAPHPVSAGKCLVIDSSFEAPPPQEETSTGRSGPLVNEWSAGRNVSPKYVEKRSDMVSRSLTSLGFRQRDNSSWKALQANAKETKETGNVKKEALFDDSLPAHLQHWLVQLMDVFDQVDADKTGAVERDEWNAALSTTGVPMDLATDLFNFVDKDRTGTIDRVEWLHMLQNVQDGACPEAIVKFSDALASLQAKNGRIYLPRVRPKYFFLIRPDGPVRVSWDCGLSVLLIYIALVTPWTFGFESVHTKALERIDTIIDAVFMADVVLNFRTAYYRQEVLVVDTKAIIINYLKTWFFLDFLTAFPFQAMQEGVFWEHLQAAKLMKIAKILKVFRLLKLGKIKQMLQDSDFFNMVEDHTMSSYSQTMLQLVRIFVTLFLMCHWMSCFMGASGHNWSLDSAGGVLEYPTALYWAMQTLTTVGYGDVHALGSFERWYATLAMVVGGAFYGYMIGMVSSTIALRDRNAAAYMERMSHVRAWLDHHTELPKSLRWRIKRYFEKHLAQKAVVEDSVILNDLSPALSLDLSYFLMNEQVRLSVLFHDLPNSALAHLLPILEQRESEPNDCIVSCGDPGTDMYIIIDGEACYEKGHQWEPRDPFEVEDQVTFTKQLASGNRGCKQRLKGGDSFGEEIILGLEEQYHYTIVSATVLHMYAISVHAFTDAFHHMPDVIHKMHANFIQNRGPSARQRTGPPRSGYPSVVEGGTPSTFPSVVLDSLQHISQCCDATESAMKGIVESIKPSRNGVAINAATSPEKSSQELLCATDGSGCVEVHM